MSDLEKMMAEFAARGGQIQKVPEGEGLGLSGRQWRAKMGYEPDVVVREEPRETEDNRITVVTDHCGREFYKNAEGEWL